MMLRSDKLNVPTRHFKTAEKTHVSYVYGQMFSLISFDFVALLVLDMYWVQKNKFNFSLNTGDLSKYIEEVKDVG